MPPPLLGVTENEVPEQIAVGVTLAIDGFGFTVTVTVKGEPIQPLVLGVTVYVAVWEISVGLISVPVIEAWALAVVPPVIPPVTVGAAHE